MKKKSAAKKQAAKKKTTAKKIVKRGRPAAKATTTRKPAAKPVRKVAKRATKRTVKPVVVTLTDEQVKAIARAVVDEIEQRVGPENFRFLQAIARYSEASEPTEDRLQKIAKAIGVKPSDLGVETASRNGRAKNEVSV